MNNNAMIEQTSADLQIELEAFVTQTKSRLDLLLISLNNIREAQQQRELSESHLTANGKQVEKRFSDQRYPDQPVSLESNRSLPRPSEQDPKSRTLPADTDSMDAADRIQAIKLRLAQQIKNA